MKRRLLKSWLVAAGLMGALAGVRAETVTAPSAYYPATVTNLADSTNFQNTNFTGGSVGIARFNKNLGTLTGVSIVLNGAQQLYSTQYCNNSGGGRTVDGPYYTGVQANGNPLVNPGIGGLSLAIGTVSRLRLYDSTGVTQLVLSSPFYNLVTGSFMPATTCTNIPDDLVSTSQTQNYTSASGQWATITSDLTYNPATDPSTKNLVVTGTKSTGMQSLGNDAMNSSTKAGAKVDVTYTYTPPKITGNVYLDLTAEAGVTPGLSGVTITLTSTDGGTCSTSAGGALGAPPCVVTTDASGNYSVWVQAGKTYTVTESQPSAWATGSAVRGGSATYANAGTVGDTNTISGILIQPSAAGAAEDYTGYNFSELAAKISGFAYQDTGAGGGTANNGTKDGTEPGIQNVAITVSSGAATCYDTVAATFRTPCNTMAARNTGADGSYSFAGLGAGTYSVSEAQPAAATYVDGITSPGTGHNGTSGTASSGKPVAEAASDAITGIGVGAGGTLVHYDFGEVPTSPILNLAKTDGTGTYTAGSTTTYTLTVTNSGGAATTGQITVIDVLPAGMTIGAGAVGLSGAQAGNWSCTAAGQNITCTSNAVIAASGTSVFGFTVNITAGTTGSLTNKAQVGGGGDGRHGVPDTTTAGECTGTNSPADSTHLGCAIDTDVAGPILSLAKTDGATTYAAGGTTTYTLTVTNNSPSSATSAQITVIDVLPAGMTISAGAVALSGAQAGNWSCTAAGQNITCTSNTVIAAGGTSVFGFTVSITAGTTGSLQNKAQVGGGGDGRHPVPDTTTAGQCTGTDAPNLGCAEDTDTAGPILSLAKTDGTLIYHAGTTTTYTLTVTNNSPSAATSAQITVIDVLPAGMTIGAGAVALSGAQAGNWSCTAAGQNITCTSNTVIAAGGTSVFGFTVNITAGTTGTLTNKAQVGGGGDGRHPVPDTTTAGQCTGTDAPNLGCAVDADTAGPILSLAKTDGTLNYNAGTTTTYTLTVTNNSPSAATSAQITVIDVLPAGMTIGAGAVALSGAQAGNWSCTAAGQNITCTSNTVIAAGGTSVFGFTVNITAGTTGALTNKAQVGGGGDGRHPVPDTTTAGQCTGTDAPNIGCAIDTDNTGPVLGLSKTDGTATYTAGGTTTYSLTVTNSGNAATSAQITVIDVLPAGMTIAAGAVALSGAQAANWSCTAAGQNITCTSNTVIGAGGTSVFGFTVSITAGTTGSLTNKAQVGGGGDGRHPTPTTGTAGGCTGTDTPSLGCAVDTDTTGAATGTISGYVYGDTNNSGSKESTDAGIVGATVKLTGKKQDGTSVSLTTTTDANGFYSFTGLSPSDATGYTITEIQPRGYTDSVNNIAPGNPGATKGAGTQIAVDGNDTITGVTLTTGQTLTNYNFAEINPSATLLPPIINGYVFVDQTHSRERLTANPIYQSGWTVTLFNSSGTAICTVTTDSNGFYQLDNLRCPGYETSGLPTGTGFYLEFSNGGSVPNAVARSGGGAGSNGRARISGLTLSPNVAVVEQNLPLDPAGTVYDAVTRIPVAGATVTITGPAGFDATTMTVQGYATMVTGTDGRYAFDLQNGYPSGTYTLTVTAPAGYLPAPSTIIPACSGALTVGATPNPALVQSYPVSPPVGVNYSSTSCVGLLADGAATVQYYFQFVITNGVSSPILNNNIPLDPLTSPPLIFTKVTPLVNVARSDLVPYTITARNTRTLAGFSNVDIKDEIPPGFRYRAGSALLDNVAVEPTVSGRILTWPNQTFAANQTKTLKMLLIVGSGVGDGLYTNQVWGAQRGTLISNIATATVRVVPDPTFDCPDVIGKVFDDRNANGYQDEGEPGIPGVRIATVRGLLVTTDAQGRFHVPCPEVPNPDRGSNFFMKLDDRTLPSGYRLTTENPRDVRLTRGKMVKLNFGATIHRVVRIELTDAAFEAGKETLQPDWQKQIEALPRQLTDKPSLVRLAYPAGADDGLIDKRLKALRTQLEKHWQDLKCCYMLVIETEGKGE